MATEMFKNASPIIFERAKELRTNMTMSESVLWEKLSGKKLDGFKFRRQHPVDRFILDFYCHEKKLAIEIDGSIHNIAENKASDLTRDAKLTELGIKVVRFTNDQVHTELDNVLNQIKGFLIVQPKFLQPTNGLNGFINKSLKVPLGI